MAGRPKTPLAWPFGDAEEFGLIGSTEWVEATEGPLSQGLHLYINADALVSGQNLRASGTPGLEGFLADAVENMDLPTGHTGPRPSWRDTKGKHKELALPGSGSDYAPFLHHLGLPVLDITFTGNSGGQYHTEYDDIQVVERFLDPGYQGHELAAHTIAALLEQASAKGRDVMDEVQAAAAMAKIANDAKKWMGARYGQAISNAFTDLSSTIERVLRDRAPGTRLPTPFYRSLLRKEGLPDRPWYRLSLWTANPESGYGSQVFPVLRHSLKANSKEGLEKEVNRQLEEIRALKNAWELVHLKAGAKRPKRNAESNR